MYIEANGCTSLTSLSAPNATYVYTNGCTSLTSLSAPNAMYIKANGCTSLTSLSAPNATTVYAGDCPNLSAQSIYDAFDNAYTLALGGVTGGTLDFSGTTTGIDDTGNSPIHNISYGSMVNIFQDYSWAITINQA
jgi:hypothetical protein